MKQKLRHYFSNLWVFWSIIGFSLCVTLFDGNIGFFFDLTLALIFLWSHNFKLIEVGIGKVLWVRTIGKSILITLLLAISIYFFVQPICEIIFGPIDVEFLDDIRGNATNYLLVIVLMWIFAAFGEELTYRGFFMKRLAVLLGGSNKGWKIAGIITSSLFALGHYYQGPSGMVTVFVVSLIYAMLFYKNRTNLILVVLVHGLDDMIGLTLIFLNLDRALTESIRQFYISLLGL